MGISVGLVGLGQFGSGFAGLFRAHPAVDRLALCDREPDRVRPFLEDSWYADKLDEADVYDSLDAICAADLDALAIFTQPWLHAPQCVQAMESGKHVYSAVPVIKLPDGDEILEWCDRLVRTVQRTGRHYMLGETTFYRPQTMFCRRKAAAGAFGDFVYAEGEYIHDLDSACSLRQVKANRLSGAAGREWQALQQQRGAAPGDGPMHYPTHSVSGPIAVMETRALEVTAYGYSNRTGDPYFEDHAFSNEMALFKLANGAVMRVCEMREAGAPMHDSESFRIVGTRGMYTEDRWADNGRTGPEPGHPPEWAALTPESMRDPLPAAVAEAFDRAREATQTSYGGHGGSHPYLIHEFVDAVNADRVPAINVWEATHYMAMGVTAHKSALADGEKLEVPDWGRAE
jgi:predicted dehydrogenase